MNDVDDTIFILGFGFDQYPAILNSLRSKFKLLIIEPEELSEIILKHSYGIIVSSEEEVLTQNPSVFDEFNGTIFLLCPSYTELKLSNIHIEQVIVKDDSSNPGDFLIREIEKAQSQNQIRQELISTNRQLKTLVYSITHDLRAPLMSLLGLVDIARSGEGIGQEEFYKLVERSISRMDEHIKTTLDYYRNQSQEVEHIQIHLPGLIHSIVEMHRNQNKIVQFEVQHNGQETIVTDPLRLKIALFNLVSNAIKYGNKGLDKYLVKIISSCQNNSLELDVIDYGPGIDPKDHERIFNQFVLDAEADKSTGLGLYLVKDAMHKIGGSVKLKSEPGKGSTFSLHIPISESF